VTVTPPSTGDELREVQGLGVTASGDYERLSDLLDVEADLDDREKCVLSLRLGLDRGGATRTIQEVSQELGVAGARISQIESQAIAKLRAHEKRPRA
jgi:RNA polymerase primary sigma factor